MKLAVVMSTNTDTGHSTCCSENACKVQFAAAKVFCVPFVGILVVHIFSTVAKQPVSCFAL